MSSTDSGHLEATVALLRRAEEEFAPRITFACSFGAEDIVLLDLIRRHAPRISIFTLDTGRLFPETYALIDRCRDFFGLPIRVLFPDATEVEAMVAQQGVDGFYRSVEARKRCCAVRKLAPLRRALEGMAAWVTGVRREQSDQRAVMEAVEEDARFGLRKYNPLIDWTSEQVWAHIRTNDLPYNPLHDRFYPSIGCAPCTRAVTVGEDPRSGRWWWERDEAVAECGLHVSEIRKGRGAEWAEEDDDERSGA
ncbi:MAG: phosphoadenylyl-sulfate reductase [Zetaproteobacteria bacterium]|nr:MAG: phosphoadenylyl-sulfate reductase [Zetaproteobacteria bacterium]